jgi:hypothetical protein
LIFAGSFRFSLTARFLTARFLTTRFLTARFLTARFLTTRFLTARFLTARFLTARFLTARFLTTRFLTAWLIAAWLIAAKFFTARPLIAVAAMRILAVRRTGMGWLGLRLARRLDAAEHAAQLFQFTFIGELLALGNLDQFENSVEFFGHLLECLGYLRGMLDRLADGRNLSRTKISRFDPRLGPRRFRAAFRPRFT